MTSIESGHGYLPIPERHPEDCGCEYCDPPEPCEACGDMPEDCNCFECEGCHEFGPLEPGYELCHKCAEVFEISNDAAGGGVGGGIMNGRIERIPIAHRLKPGVGALLMGLLLWFAIAAVWWEAMMRLTE